MTKRLADCTPEEAEAIRARSRTAAARKYQREYYERNREKVLSYQRSDEAKAKSAEYRSALRGRAEMPPAPEIRRCSGCATDLPATSFHRERSARSGLSSRCRACKRDAQLRSKYGIDSTSWDALFEAQGRRCAICLTSKRPRPGWQTDHCHETGTVRSILCNWCNTAVGSIENGWQMPDRAAIERYLSR